MAPADPGILLLYKLALGIPLNKTLVRAFLMLMSMLPGYALSMRRKATSRPEGSTMAMFWGTIVAAADSAALTMDWARVAET